MLAVLLAEGQEPAPSSKSIHGSISNSLLSCCFDFPDALAATLDGIGFLRGVAELLKLKPGVVLLV
jgi:hypothetical protein